MSYNTVVCEKSKKTQFKNYATAPIVQLLVARDDGPLRRSAPSRGSDTAASSRPDTQYRPDTRCACPAKLVYMGLIHLVTARNIRYKKNKIYPKKNAAKKSKSRGNGTSFVSYRTPMSILGQTLKSMTHRA